jgi:putative transposase
VNLHNCLPLPIFTRYSKCPISVNLSEMFKAYKYRLNPNIEQRIALSKNMGCARWVYNWALSRKIEAYQKENRSLSCFDLMKELPKLKAAEETKWLAEANAQSLQNSLRNLDNAFTRFFREKKGFPKFKSKKCRRQSFQIPQRVQIDFETRKIILPKIGAVRAKLHRKFDGIIKTVTISKTPSGKYFASVLVETDEKPLPKPEIKYETTIGIDLGLTHFAILSNGEKIENPKHLQKSLNRLKFLQRRLSRKKVGSKRRDKARICVAKLYEKITNQRNDFLHKLSIRFIRENQTIALETLNIAGMMQNHRLAQSIASASWYRFVEFLRYKAEWYGRNIVFIGRFEPSSKLCSVCGFHNGELTLADRTWTCPSCQTEHDRDVNAATNIRKFALQSQNLVGREPSEISSQSVHDGGTVKRETSP